MSLTGKHIRYTVPNTRKPYWEGVIIGETDRAVWVTVTTPGYEGCVEWIASEHILSVRSEQGQWIALQQRSYAP